MKYVFWSFLLCWRTEEACRMIKRLHKVDFSHPTGHFIWKKSVPLEKILGAPLYVCNAYIQGRTKDFLKGAIFFYVCMCKFFKDFSWSKSLSESEVLPSPIVFPGEQHGIFGASSVSRQLGEPPDCVAPWNGGRFWSDLGLWSRLLHCTALFRQNTKPVQRNRLKETAPVSCVVKKTTVKTTRTNICWQNQGWPTLQPNARRLCYFEMRVCSASMVWFLKKSWTIWSPALTLHFVI